MALNGAKTWKRGDTIFVALPAELQEPIPYSCACPYCTAHPDQPPMWDTLAVHDHGQGGAATVHYPERPLK